MKRMRIHPVSIAIGVSAVAFVLLLQSMVQHGNPLVPGPQPAGSTIDVTTQPPPRLIFRMDQANGGYTVPVTKFLIITQLSAPTLEGAVGCPVGTRVRLFFNDEEVWRITMDTPNSKFMSSGMINPGLVASTETVVQIRSTPCGAIISPGIAIGYLTEAGG